MANGCWPSSGPTNDHERLSDGLCHQGGGEGLHLRGTECRAPAPASHWFWPFLTNQGDHGWFATLKQSGMVTRFGWIVDYPLDHVYERNGVPGGAYDNQRVLPNPNFRGTITKADLPVMLPVLVRGLSSRWSAGIWYKGENLLKVIEYPHRVVGRRCQDEILRIGVLNDMGYLQVDLDDADRDVFIGNLLVADQPDVCLTLLQDPGQASVLAHNPTDNPITTTVRPGPGFELFGDFQKQLTVPPGSSVIMAMVLSSWGIVAHPPIPITSMPAPPHGVRQSARGNPGDGRSRVALSD